MKTLNEHKPVKIDRFTLKIEIGRFTYVLKTPPASSPNTPLEIIQLVHDTLSQVQANHSGLLQKELSL